MSLPEFFKQFYTIFFVWLAGFTALFVIRRSLPLSYRFLALLVILVSLFETTAFILASRNIKNHFLFNISDAIQFIVLPYFFYLHLRGGRIKKIISIYFWVFPFLVLVNTIWIQGFRTLHTYTFVLGGGFVLSLSVMYLWELYNSKEKKDVFTDPMFWFSAAYLAYFTIAVPYLGMLNYLWSMNPSFTRWYYLIVYNGGLIINKILLTAGFLCLKYITMK